MGLVGDKPSVIVGKSTAHIQVEGFAHAESDTHVVLTICAGGDARFITLPEQLTDGGEYCHEVSVKLPQKEELSISCFLPAERLKAEADTSASLGIDRISIELANEQVAKPV